MSIGSVNGAQGERTYTPKIAKAPVAKKRPARRP
jgi:hypothetical protein